MKEPEASNKKPPKLFISFCSKDKDSVRELMTILKYQGVYFWDYSNEVEAIEIASDIPTRLSAEIDNCNYFIPIISKYSNDPTTGKFTIYEVEYAMNKGLLSQGKVIPIAIGDRIPHNWNGIYADLKNICYLELNTKNERKFINAIIRLCDTIGVEFDPFAEAHQKLPFLKLFQQEVRNLQHKTSEHLFLAEILGVFSRYFKNKRWTDCLFLINYFIDTCQYFMPEYHCFYPYIVRAVCERQLNLLEKAGLSYKQAMKVQEQDVNVYGGLAGLYEQRGELENAKIYAKKALEICPPNENIDEIFNYTSILFQLGEKIPDKYRSVIINLEPENFSGDEFNLLNLKGALYYSNGQYKKAIEVFEVMEENKTANTTTIGYHLNSLLALNQKEQALILLKNSINWSRNSSEIDRSKIEEYIQDMISS